MRNKIILIVLLLSAWSVSYGQTWTGGTTADVGQSVTYSFTNGTLYSGIHWATANGSATTTWSVGATYFATILWNSPASPSSLTLLDGSNIPRANTSITVSIGTPVTTFTTTQGCASTTITRVASPPAGVNWYWQTTAGGTSTTNNTSTYVVSSTGTYYLRARWGTSGAWSTNALSTGAVTVAAAPAAPASSTDGNAISNTSTPVTLAVSTVSGATSYKWYDQSSGGTLLNTTATPTWSPSIAVTKQYWVASATASGTCESLTRRLVTGNIHPEPVLTATNSGVVDLNDPVTVSVSNYTYSSYQWLDINGNTIAGATASAYATSKSGTYRIRVTKGNSPSFTSSSGPQISSPTNFIISTDVLVDNVTTESAANALAIGSRAMTIQYFDGLGRPLQSVSKQGSPNMYDIVQPSVYDGYGREVKQYLPFASSSDVDGHYKDNTSLFAVDDDYTHNFYRNASSTVAYDTRPFGKTVYDDSPLNRALKSYGPGSDWHTNDKFVQRQDLVNVYGTGAGQDKVILWTINGSGLPVRKTAINSGYYPSGTLNVTSAVDEAGNETRMYTNRLGQMVLKMMYLTGSKTDLTSSTSADNWTRIYYIYDDQSNLRFVLQPVLVKTLVPSNTLNPTQTDLDNYGFQYQYDTRQRMIQKILPGALPIIMVYDDRDRIVMTQDGNQRALSTKEWTFIKYDRWNRPVLTGKYADTGGNSQSAMQGIVNTYYTGLTGSQAWFESYIGSGGGNVLGYDNKSFPQVSSASDYYSATYYDKYDSFIAPAGYTYSSETLTDPETSIVQEAASNTDVIGLVTGGQIKNLATNTWMRSVSYFDSKYRIIQSIGDHQKGKTTLSLVLDFAGKPLLTKRSYVVNGVTTAIKERYKYDHAGRVLWAKHSINGGAEVMLAKNIYNEIGQVVDKNLHSTDFTNFKQSVDYRYNIRGWMTKINEADVSAIASGDAVVDHFGMELAYNTTIANLTTTKSYTGNISAVQWSKGNGGTLKKQAYSFDYDNINRLSTALHYDHKISDGTWLSNNDAYRESQAYDLNGNIVSMIRKGFNGTAMDNLAYNYTGNKLNYVHDTGDALTGFVNGNTGTDDYGYDSNGNVYKDKNKGIANNGDIKYNFLNLPVEITKSTGEKVKYIYDASGRKLAQEVYNTSGTVTKVTDYIGELVFEGTSPVLKFIQHAEGRILPDGGGWEYQYHLKDHLGNVRVTFTGKTQTPATFTTNFESATNTDFLNYSNNTFDLVDHTDAAGTVYQKTQLLNGGQSNGRVGLAKSVAVMPGDEITFSAWVKYMTPGGGSNFQPLITSLAGAFGVSAGSTGEQLKIYNALNAFSTSYPAGERVGDEDTPPKAFVTILFFDKNYNLVDAAWDQVSTVGSQTGAVKQPPHDLVTITAKAPQAGYAYAFLSNENVTSVNVYFDDATFSHTPSPIVSVSDYFPYGLTYNNGERENSLEQKYLYNGKELQDELSLNWYDYGARMYMPEIGRWGVIDPLAEKNRRWNPYAYAVDNPVMFIDPDGMDAEYHGAQAQEFFKAHLASTSWKSFRERRAERKAGSQSGTIGETSGGSGENTQQAASGHEVARQQGGCPKGMECQYDAKGNIIDVRTPGKDSDKNNPATSTDLILAGVGSAASVADFAAKRVGDSRDGLSSGKLSPNSPRVYSKSSAKKVYYGAKGIGWGLTVWGAINTEIQYSNGEIKDDRRVFNHVNNGVGAVFPQFAIPIAAGDYYGQTHADEIANDMTQEGGVLFEITKFILQATGIPTSSTEKKK